ncbi:TPA: cation-translocating P-type ATPase [Candidatus Micrarchaeota archaeon]|nr:cation-translocating P-type ATPase [Candidatus Micrarchaeota archaeon]
MSFIKKNGILNQTPNAKEIHFHSLSGSEALEAIKSAANGLSSAEAERRLKEFGKNKLSETKGRSVLQMVVSEFTSFLILILLAAAAASWAVGETTDAALILVIVALNACLGVAQEYRAEKAIQALKSMAAPQARVLRNGTEQLIPSTQLVAGDVILLEEGDRIPADCRLLQTINFETQEAALTGESAPVQKNAVAIAAPTAMIAERSNTAFASTIAVRGRAKAVVIATAMNTQLGAIAKMVSETEREETPLQKKLDSLGKQLSAGAIAACAVIFALGLMRGHDLLETFLIAVSLAVAAVPEGLPAIVTITLAIGMQRMAKRNAIMRRLGAVETLGSTTVICSDKTGTLTKNEMTVTRVYADNSFVEVSGTGYQTIGTFDFDNKRVSPLRSEALYCVLRTAALCNNASLATDSKGTTAVTGDPTEAALLVLAAKAGLTYKELQEENAFVNEIPFESERKMMTAIRKTDGTNTAFVKGACESIFPRCTSTLINGRETPLTPELRKCFADAESAMTKSALRVIATAQRKLPNGVSAPDVENELVLTGLIGMIDPPRPEAKQAVEQCKTAGIRVVMITGDSPLTAAAIARELGILENQKVVTGPEIETMDETQLREATSRIAVYARVNPGHKLKIVSALQANGEIVAMTGDGVNDAPALKKAEIGISMGITGTDVARESSSMVLADDNFASIVKAVEKGRTIYANISKSIIYLVSCNAGELLTVFAAGLLALPNPLSAAQILWMNLVTDGLPAIALGIDPADKNAMHKPPRSPKHSILNKKTLSHILTIAAFACIATLALYTLDLNWQLGAGATEASAEAHAKTIAFATIIFIQLFVAIDSRALNESLLKIDLFSNKKLLGAIALAASLQIAVTTIPFFQQIFGTVALTINEWLLITTVSACVLIVSEARKRLECLNQNIPQQGLTLYAN